MLSIEDLHANRLEGWRQTPHTRIQSPQEAGVLIEQVGIATLYPVSSEVPNLFQAYMGDSEAKTDSEWDSPSGEVYSWRWYLGRQETAFYTAIVRSRPTWVRWDLLPALLRLRGELRSLEELYAAGELSRDAIRIGEALQAAGTALSTGELRRQAGFPTGKAERAAYLKAVEELDTRLLLAKVFSKNDEEMYHALVFARYPQHVQAAERMTRKQALVQLLMAYLPHARYALPALLAKHLKLPEAELHAGLDHLVQRGCAAAISLPESRSACYVWNED
ncbi:MAG TPA: hypothetical protein VKU00_22320 [Chthonomonadaceae bacterium]|nr:hypothetical protein [Chthonomonadaceae bacterium]